MEESEPNSAMKDIVISILKCADSPENDETMCHIESLCSSLLSKLPDRKFYPEKSSLKSRSVRDVLGNLPSTMIAKFTTVIANLIAYRVDPLAFLPATQDTVANEDAMTNTAITLTSQSFLAAKLYAELVAMPGSCGAGIIQVGALSSLAAFMKRWNVECCGNMNVNCDDEIHGYSNKRKTDTRTATYTKRSRTVDVDTDDSDTEDFGGALDGASTNVILTPYELKFKGLDLSSSVAAILFLKELQSWSDEAREVVIECTVNALMTASAIASAGLTASKSGKRYIHGNDVVLLLSSSLQTCAINASLFEASVDDDDETVSTNKGGQTNVFILRGLLPVIAMQTEVPYGQNGKQAARDISVSTLEEIIKQVSKECELQVKNMLNSSGALSVMKTPMSFKHRSHTDGIDVSEHGEKGRELFDCQPSTPKTSRKKKRVSFGIINGKRVTKLNTPILKVTNTPTRIHSCQSKSEEIPNQSKEIPRLMLTAVVGLLQRLAAFKGLDRAAVRAQTIDAIMRCLSHLPRHERACFLRFLIQICLSKVSIHRLVGVELVGSCLSKVWFWNDHSEANASLNVRTPVSSAARKTLSQDSSLPRGEALEKSMPIALLGCLNGRLGDKAPAVRARAAYAVTEMIRSFEAIPVKENDEEMCIMPKFAFAMRMIGGDILESLRKRSALDSRATVRRGAINALSALLMFGSQHEPSLMVSDIEIQMLSHLCIDESVATRKAAAEALTSLLEMEEHCQSPCSTVLENAWTSSVLPLILDVEPACVSTALDCFYRIVIEPVINMKGKTDDPPKFHIIYETAWRILARINVNSFNEGATKGEYESLREVFRKATEHYGDAAMINFFNELRDVARRSLDGDATSEHLNRLRSGCWCIFGALTDQAKDIPIFTNWIKRKSVGFDFLTSSWQSMIELYESDMPEEFVSSLHSSMRFCLRFIAKIASHLHIHQFQDFSNSLIALVGSFSIGPELLGAAMSALVEIARRCNDSNDILIVCSRLIKDLYQRCEEEMCLFVTNGKGDEKRLVRSIFLTGELAMIGFKSDEDSISKESRGTASDRLAGFYEKPSQQLLSLGQMMLASNLPQSDVETPEAARAHAFVTLGKLCLRDEALAKKCLNLFARELHQSITETSASVKSNALLVMGDLYVRYTNLVDRYLPVMAACLQAGIRINSDISFLGVNERNGASLVRKHAVLMLTSLLLQDYIKWRGLMFHRFLVASADDDEGVAKLAEMTLCGPLIRKFPKLFLNNFVESLFVLNRCTAHPIYMSAALSGDSGSGIAVGFDGINLSGAIGRVRRMQMYKLMLSRMSDEDKLGVIARLAKDVLGAALDSNGDMGRVCLNPSLSCTPAKGCQTLQRDESAANVLSDAFSVLTSPFMKVGRALANSDEDESVEESNKARQITTAKGNLMVKISRKQMIEIVLPIVSRLKAILQSSCSPLLKELMQFMTLTFNMYKNEVREFLANDPTLLQEVEYDAKQFKKSVQNRSSGGQDASILASPHWVTGD